MTDMSPFWKLILDSMKDDFLSPGVWLSSCVVTIVICENMKKDVCIGFPQIPALQ